MSKNSITCSLAVLFALIVSFVLVSAELSVVSAQNSNSSTTQEEPTRGGMMTTENSNMAPASPTPRRRRRPRRPRPVATMSSSDNANMTTDTAMPAQTGMMDAADGGKQEDLAGMSYTGTVEYSEGSMSGPATLAFESGNQFTLTPEGGTAMSGRYSAVTTRGYTGVTMNFSGMTPPAIVSVRLKKMGNGVSIMSVPGETRQFSFTAAGSSGGNRPRRKKPRKRGMTPPTGIKPPMGTDTPTP